MVWWLWLLALALFFVVLALKNNFTYEHCAVCDSHVRTGAPRCTSCGAPLRGRPAQVTDPGAHLH